MPANFSMSFGTPTSPSLHYHTFLKDKHGNVISEGNYYGNTDNDLRSRIAADATTIKSQRGSDYVSVDVFVRNV